MLEQIFQNPATGPATSRGAIYRPAPARQKSPLEQFLQAQTFGKQQAGGAAPSYAHLGAAGAITAPSFAPAKGAAPSIDPASIQSFYSDPANADYHADPALLGIRAADNTTRGNADVEALKGRRQVLTQLGNHGIAEQILGPNDETLGAISDNPDQSTSILARLARAYRDTTNTNEDQLNKSNLFYSSERGRVLGNDAKDYATQQADAIASAQAQLDSISGALASAKSGADQSDAQAEQDAFNRYMAAVAAHPPSSTPGGGKVPPSDGSTAQVIGPTGTIDTIPATPETNAILGDMNPSGPAASPYDQEAAQAQAQLGLNELGGSFAAAPMPEQLAAQQGAQDYLAQFLQPPKKPLSGYAAGSGSALH